MQASSDLASLLKYWKDMRDLVEDLHVGIGIEESYYQRLNTASLIRIYLRLGILNKGSRRLLQVGGTASDEKRKLIGAMNF
jgi:hypothetical protein